ncbi:MAG: type II secretion system protein GspM [Verrucomicrobiota bacterium]|nr:type II secretion system protein GspM [Verrucomicrobiota bacterium]
MNLVGVLSRISTRERTMLAGLVVIGFMIWLSVLWRNWEAVSNQHRKARHELDKQEVWLGNADRFDRELGEILSRLDPKATLNADALVALVDGMARDGGLKHDLGTPGTVERKVFLQHTLRVGIKNVPLTRLIDFERSLRTNHPYATLEDFSITANRADPRLLNARLTVTSYELKQEAQEAE